MGRRGQDMNSSLQSFSSCGIILHTTLVGYEFKTFISCRLTTMYLIVLVQYLIFLLTADCTRHLQFDLNKTLLDNFLFKQRRKEERYTHTEYGILKQVQNRYK